MFFNAVYQDVIDITKGSTDMALIREWRASNEIALSDCRRIDLDMGMDSTPIAPFRNARMTDVQNTVERSS